MPASPLPTDRPSRRTPRTRASLAVLASVALLAACGGGARPSSSPAPGASLVIPVKGVRPEELRDTYDDARSEGRSHHAIDIMARKGTPVLAAADGRVLKLRSNGLGGITVYQVGPDGRTLYYYAHLSGYARGMKEGKDVRRGEVIAYVGDTGNAGAGNYHLHFSVGRLPDPHRWWESENVDPYPLLAGDAARATVPRAIDPPPAADGVGPSSRHPAPRTRTTPPPASLGCPGGAFGARRVSWPVRRAKTLLSAVRSA
ncbi:MAG: hypothetical protein JWM27_2520 [Gemmatimonadetes bacterium]|nr:hypothetical protein [Gemmatimonadota bacterium]